MNYTFQSFNFRERQSARPFYDLIANIAAEEYGHIELVAATINSMLTGASPTSDGAPAKQLARRRQGQGQPAALHRRRRCLRTPTGGRGTETTSIGEVAPGPGKVEKMVDKLTP